jgi:hypothetical protein
MRNQPPGEPRTPLSMTGWQLGELWISHRLWRLLPGSWPAWPFPFQKRFAEFLLSAKHHVHHDHPDTGQGVLGSAAAWKGVLRPREGKQGPRALSQQVAANLDCQPSSCHPLKPGSLGLSHTRPCSLLTWHPSTFPPLLCPCHWDVEAETSKFFWVEDLMELPALIMSLSKPQFWL